MAINIVEEIESVARKSEQVVLEAIKSWAETAQATLRETKARVPFGDQLPLADRVPFAEHLPSPKQVVTSVYDFAEAMLAHQRKLAEHALDAAFPKSDNESDNENPAA
jgi:hypothetical protein